MWEGAKLQPAMRKADNATFDRAGPLPRAHTTVLALPLRQDELDLVGAQPGLPARAQQVVAEKGRPFFLGNLRCTPGARADPPFLVLGRGGRPI